MKILITGGAGYIGSHTIIELIRQGFNEVVSVDNFLNSSEVTYSRIEKITGIKIKHYSTDLKNIAALDEVFTKEKFDSVIHFAALKSVPESVASPIIYYQNNLLSLTNVLEMMKKHDVNQLIYSSSCSVYGNVRTLPVTEETELQQAESPYALTKQIGESLIENLCSIHPRFKAISLRYFNPAGAHDSGLTGEVKTQRPSNLVPLIAMQAAGLLEELIVFGNDYNTVDGTCVRDYIHVSDIANAHVKALTKIDDLDTNYCVYNLGSGTGMTTLKVIDAFEKINKVKINYSIGPRRAGDVEAIFAGNSKAKKGLAWEIRHDIHSICNTAWKWQLNSSS